MTWEGSIFRRILGYKCQSTVANLQLETIKQNYFEKRMFVNTNIANTQMLLDSMKSRLRN